MLLMRTLALVLAACSTASAQEFRLPVDAAALVQGARAAAARARAMPRPRAQALAPAVNRGFAALGPAGATGRVKAGPFGVGNGTYRVAVNDAYLVQFDVSTPYISGRFTLKRDQSTGKDQLGFSGKLKDPNSGEWSSVSSLDDGAVTYDPASDSGTIAWRLRGQTQQDSYRDGGSGGDMTVSLSGHDHEFIRD